MKYEDIKIGDTYTIHGTKVKAISKIDEYRTTIAVDENGDVTAWSEDELNYFKLIEEQLPEEGLLASNNGTLVYRTGESSGYGFGFDGDYISYNHWSFIENPGVWKTTTPEQKVKFIEMLKKECENRGLFEDTKIEKHTDGYSTSLNSSWFTPKIGTTEAWNKNGKIFHRGKFATPRKETTLELVAKSVKEIGDFTIEQTESGVIILTPIKIEK